MQSCGSSSSDGSGGSVGDVADRLAVGPTAAEVRPDRIKQWAATLTGVLYIHAYIHTHTHIYMQYIHIYL